MSPMPSDPPSLPFERSAKYYDVIYGKKDYAREAAIAAEYLKSPSIGRGGHCSRLIEWGCGTGGHLAHWGSHGWDAIGIEPCPEMAAIAAAKGCKIRPGDICSDARDAQPIAGAAVCLFGSFSYAATDNDRLRAALTNVRFHLSAGARFVFDVVNLACAAGKLRHQSYSSFTIGDDGKLVLLRSLKKWLDVESSLVHCDLDFSLIEYSGELSPIRKIGDDGQPTDEVIASFYVPPKEPKESWTEHHVMRAFSPPELRYALADCNFNVVAVHDPETNGVVRNDSYYFQVVAESC